MTNIASGRAEFLQKEIVQAIKNLEKLDKTSILPSGIVKDVFGDLLEDPVISSKIKLTAQDENPDKH